MEPGLVNLHSSESGQGPPVVLLHGLFGAGSNLGALARSLRDRYRVFSLDLPNHGRSQWQEDSSLAAMTATLVNWLDASSTPQALFVGHSLGGKLAMQLALTHPQRVKALVVADIAPVTYEPRHDAVFKALDAVAAAQCTSREEAATIMSAHLDESGVVQFLLMSLRAEGDGVYRWRFNLEGIKRNYAAVRLPPGPGNPFTGPAQFVKGGESNYILPEHRAEVLRLFPAAQMKVMPGCGHWLHVEQPSLFNGIVGRFLDAVE